MFMWFTGSSTSFWCAATWKKNDRNCRSFFHEIPAWSTDLSRACWKAVGRKKLRWAAKASARLFHNRNQSSNGSSMAVSRRCEGPQGIRQVLPSSSKRHCKTSSHKSKCSQCEGTIRCSSRKLALSATNLLSNHRHKWQPWSRCHLSPAKAPWSSALSLLRASPFTCPRATTASVVALIATQAAKWWYWSSALYRVPSVKTCCRSTALEGRDSKQVVESGIASSSRLKATSAVDLKGNKWQEKAWPQASNSAGSQAPVAVRRGKNLGQVNPQCGQRPSLDMSNFAWWAEAQNVPEWIAPNKAVWRASNWVPQFQSQVSVKPLQIAHCQARCYLASNKLHPSIQQKRLEHAGRQQ